MSNLRDGEPHYLTRLEKEGSEWKKDVKADRQRDGDIIIIIIILTLVSPRVW